MFLKILTKESMSMESPVVTMNGSSFEVICTESQITWIDILMTEFHCTVIPVILF